MGERKNKIREPRKRTSSYILEILQNIIYTPKKHIQKYAHIKYHSLPQNPPHLSWKEMSKQSYLDFSSESHKSCDKALSLWKLGPESSWLTHFHENHLHICICFRMYILTWGTNNCLRIFVLYSCSYAKATEIKGNDKNPLHSEHGERSYCSRN